MAESLKTVSIVPLKGSNYATWKVQCTMALKKDGVWSIVDGTEVAPGRTAGEKERERYASRKDKALATIVLSVDPSLLYLVGADPEDPVVVWNKLKEQFQKKSWVNRLNLRRSGCRRRAGSSEVTTTGVGAQGRDNCGSPSAFWLSNAKEILHISISPYVMPTAHKAQNKP